MGRDDRQDIDARRRAGQDTDSTKAGKTPKLDEMSGFDRRGEPNPQIDQDRAGKGFKGSHRGGKHRGDRG